MMAEVPDGLHGTRQHIAYW